MHILAKWSELAERCSESLGHSRSEQRLSELSRGGLTRLWLFTDVLLAPLKAGLSRDARKWSAEVASQARRERELSKWMGCPDGDWHIGDSTEETIPFSGSYCILVPLISAKNTRSPPLCLKRAQFFYIQGWLQWIDLNVRRSLLDVQP